MAIFAQSTPLGTSSFLNQRSVPSFIVLSRRITLSAKAANVDSNFLGFAREKKTYNAITTKPRASMSQSEPSDGKDEIAEILDNLEVKSSSAGSSFLAKLAVAIGVAATVTLVSVYMRRPSTLMESPLSFPRFLDASSESPVGFTLTLFGKKIILPKRTLGWVYFWFLIWCKI